MPIGTRGWGSYWQDWANLAVGAWLFVSPWILRYSGHGAAGWNSWLCGIAIFGLSVAALILFMPWQEWINVALGVWLLVAPWVLGFAGVENAPALWNHVGVGLAVGVFSLWDALAHGTEDRITVR